MGAWKSSATLKIKSGFHFFANRNNPPCSHMPAEKYSALVSMRPSGVRLARPQIRFVRMGNCSLQDDSPAIRLATATAKSSRSTKCRCSAKQPPPQWMAGITELMMSTRGFIIGDVNYAPSPTTKQTRASHSTQQSLRRWHDADQKNAQASSRLYRELGSGRELGSVCIFLQDRAWRRV